MVYFWTFKMADNGEDLPSLFVYEKCYFSSHNEYIEFDGGGVYL